MFLIFLSEILQWPAFNFHPDWNCTWPLYLVPLETSLDRDKCTVNTVTVTLHLVTWFMGLFKLGFSSSYCLVREAKKPNFIRLDKKTNKELTTQTKMLCEVRCIVVEFIRVINIACQLRIYNQWRPPPSPPSFSPKSKTGMVIAPVHYVFVSPPYC